MHDAPETQLAELRRYLERLPVGDISDSERTEVLNRLVEVWERLPGGEDQSTTSRKLGRAEKLRWAPSDLTFILERHGGTVNGSSRASLHHWVVNVESGHASLSKRGIRQLTPMDKRFDAKAAAKEVAKLIIEQRHDPRINWLANGVVQVVLTKAAPSGSEQTQADRNRRLRQALNAELSASGWNPLPGNRCLFKRNLAE